MAVMAQQPASSSDAMMNPPKHLAEANQALDSIPQSVQADAEKPLAELRGHFAELASVYGAQGDQIGPRIAWRDPANKPPNWRDSFSAVERDLTRLIGGGPSLAPFVVSGAHAEVSPTAADATAAAPTNEPAPAGSAGGVPTAADLTVGTAGAGASTPAPMPGTGTAARSTDAGAMVARIPAEPPGPPAEVGTDGVKDLDPALREKLDRLRLDLELFYASTMGDPGGAPPQPPAR